MNKNLYIGKRLFSSLLQKFYSLFNIKIKPNMIANFAVTSKCNLYCKTCNIGLEYMQNPKLADSDLTLTEIDNFFSTNQAFLKGVNWIQITGGEPFLRKDLSKIVEIIGRYLPHCSIWIATNGFMTSRIIEQVKEMLGGNNAIGVGVSLHGLEKFHDGFTGIVGSYRNAIVTVAGLKKLREEFPKLRISLSFTLFRENFNELLPVFDLSKKLVVDFTLRPTNYSNNYYKNREDDLIFRGDKAKLESVLQNFIKQSNFDKIWFNLKKIPRLYYYNGILDFIREPHCRRLICLAGSSSFFLDAKGNVYPCLILGSKLGNIRKQTLAQIWDSKDTQRIQQAIKKGNCPNCWVECETYRTIYENPHCLLKFAIKKLFKKNFQNKQEHESSFYIS